MEEELTNLPFEAWITFIFDHPVPVALDSLDRYENNDDDSQWWDPLHQPEVTVAYLTTLFENATRVLTPFSDAQVKEGLWFLVSGACSDHMFTLLNPDVPWPERKHCISSMYTLFERFFASRCSSHLSHLDEPGANPLNVLCYMWWDILLIYGQPKDPDRAEIDAACLEVMQMTLDLASDACRESALHGLGHWHLEYPKQVEAAIDRFLGRNPDLRPELKTYARSARKGRVQ